MKKQRKKFKPKKFFSAARLSLARLYLGLACLACILVYAFVLIEAASAAAEALTVRGASWQPALRQLVYALAAGALWLLHLHAWVRLPRKKQRPWWSFEGWYASFLYQLLWLPILAPLLLRVVSNKQVPVYALLPPVVVTLLSVGLYKLSAPHLRRLMEDERRTRVKTKSGLP